MAAWNIEPDGVTAVDLKAVHTCYSRNVVCTETSHTVLAALTTVVVVLQCRVRVWPKSECGSPSRRPHLIGPG